MCINHLHRTNIHITTHTRFEMAHRIYLNCFLCMSQLRHTHSVRNPSGQLIFRVAYSVSILVSDYYYLRITRLRILLIKKHIFFLSIFFFPQLIPIVRNRKKEEKKRKIYITHEIHSPNNRYDFTCSAANLSCSFASLFTYSKVCSEVQIFILLDFVRTCVCVVADL